MPENGERPLITITFLTAVMLFFLLQEIGLRLRREEHRAWWAENGRDLLNGAGCAAIAGSLWLLGFTAPVALLLGATLTLALFGGYVFFTTQTSLARPRLWASGLGLLMALTILIWPEEVLSAAESLMEALFHHLVH